MCPPVLLLFSWHLPVVSLAPASILTCRPYFVCGWVVTRTRRFLSLFVIPSSTIAAGWSSWWARLKLPLFRLLVHVASRIEVLVVSTVFYALATQT